jgi:hypothetical protein
MSLRFLFIFSLVIIPGFLLVASFCSFVPSKKIKNTWKVEYKPLDAEGTKNGARAWNERGWDCFQSFDTNGRRMEWIIFSRDSLLSMKDTFAYNAAGQLVETKHFDRNYLFTGTTTYTYNALNQLAEKKYVHLSSSATVTTYSYNTEGLLIRETEYNKSIPCTSRVLTYRYDKSGARAREKNYWGYGGCCKKTGRYLSSKCIYRDGNPYKLIFYDYLFVSTWVIYEFDERGNYAAGTEYNRWGKIIETEVWKYSYDEYGNWIREVEFVNGIAKKIYERTITYYR